MSNLKISQLPEYTGNTYNGYVIWNDSGETTTYKTRYKVTLTPGLNPTNIVTNGTDPSVEGSNASSSILLGYNSRSYSDLNIVIGHNSNTNEFDELEGRSVLIGNNCSLESRYSVCIGNSSSLRFNPFYAVNIGHEAITETGFGTVNIGARAKSSGENSITILANKPFTDFNNPTNNSVFISGRNNHTFNTTGDFCSMINGSGNTITDDVYYSQIFGGSNNTISGSTSGVTLMGIHNFTGPAENDTTYVDNFQVLGQAKYGNYNNGSQGTSYEIDWNNGNIQKVLLTGNTTFSATNITDGTTYILKVVQDATGSRTATWTSSQFKFPNSTPPTLSTGANAVDILTFVAMDGVLYGVAQLNFG
jgi:hypothetical protein